MSRPTLLQTSLNMTDTENALLSSSTSNEVHASTPCPPVPYCHGDSKSNDQLIHKATTRLRCRLLEQGLIDAKTKVSHLQGELDNLRIELSTTENVLSNSGEPDDRQLLALERRFNTHQQQLDLLLSSTSTQAPHLQQPRPQLQENAITASTSFSSTLSRMSSIFSSRQKPFKKSDQPSTVPVGSDYYPHHHQHSDSSVTNDTYSTSESDNNNDLSQHPTSDLDTQERRMRRRERVRQLSQEYQQRLRTYDPTWNDNGEHDWRSMTTPPSMNGNKDTPDEPATTTSTTAISTTTHSEQHQKPLPPSKKQQEQQPPTITNAIGKRKSVTKHTSNATKKPMMTSTKPTIQSKPPAAPCLCKRKITNKADPIKAASSPHSPTYHSKQPEKVLLETQQQKQQQHNHHPLSPLAVSPLPTPASAAEIDETTHTLPPQPSDSNVLALPSPGPSNVSDWLLKQRQYHLEQQHQRNDDDDEVEEDKEGAWIKKETLIDNQQHLDAMPIGNNNDNNNNNDSMMKPLPQQMKQPSSSTMTIFDDVLRYLDTMSDFGNDSGLQQDLSHLLAGNSSNSSRAPSLCSSISSALSFSTVGSYYNHRFSSSVLKTQSYGGGLVGKYYSRYLVDGVNKSLSWCKFLSVLSLALLISLGRGPDHMLLSLDDLDYLDLMADQGEPLVHSYYL